MVEKKKARKSQFHCVLLTVRVPLAHSCQEYRGCLPRPSSQEDEYVHVIRTPENIQHRVATH